MKWWGYLICFILIIIAIFFGVKMGRIYFSRSKSFGEDIVTSWTGKTETFSYSQVDLNLSFDNETNKYVSSLETLRVEDYDGNKAGYQILINDETCSSATYGTSNIRATLHKQFVDVDENVIADTTLTIRINFLIDKTTIEISCADDQISANCWDNYFKNFGFRLSVQKYV